jgi:hypothetical protein
MPGISYRKYQGLIVSKKSIKKNRNSTFFIRLILVTFFRIQFFIKLAANSQINVAHVHSYCALPHILFISAHIIVLGHVGFELAELNFRF